MDNSKKICLVGRSDHDNFGDSLMFCIYLKELRAAAPNSCLFIYLPSETFATRIKIEGIEFQALYNPAQLSSMDLVLFIGGGYFSQPDRQIVAWNLRYIRDSFFFGIAKTLTAQNIPYHVIGVEVGPLTFPRSRKITEFVVKHASSVIVRNAGSRNYCREHFGVEPISLNDVVLEGARRYASPDLMPYPTSNTLGIHATGVILKPNIISRQIRKNLISFIKEAGIDRAELIFDQSTYTEQLLKHAHRFIAEIESSTTLSAKHCNIQVYDGVSRTLQTLQLCRYLVTSKLHLGMSALSMGVKVLCISNQTKCKRFYNESHPEGAGHLSLTKALLGTPQITASMFLDRSMLPPALFVDSYKNIEHAIQISSS